MLQIVIGKAGTGKTAAMMKKIKDAVEHRVGGQFLIVPEQYSHEAERELCRKMFTGLLLFSVENVRRILLKLLIMTANMAFLTNVNAETVKLLIFVLLRAQNWVGV